MEATVSPARSNWSPPRAVEVDTCHLWPICDQLIRQLVRYRDSYKGRGVYSEGVGEPDGSRDVFRVRCQYCLHFLRGQLVDVPRKAIAYAVPTRDTHGLW